MKKSFRRILGIVVGFISVLLVPVMAQATWQHPPKPIAAMLDTPWYPGVIISPNQQWLVRLHRPALTPLAELAQPRLALAGLQLNPTLRAPAQAYGFVGLTVQTMATGAQTAIALPQSEGIRNFSWSPTGNLLAFTLDQSSGVALWVADMAIGQSLATHRAPPQQYLRCPLPLAGGRCGTALQNGAP
jgi:hypothetical protein